MPPAYSRIKIVHAGTIQSTQDFSWGITVADAAGATPSHAQLVTYLTAVRLLANTLLGAGTGPIVLASADTEYLELRAYVLPPNTDVAVTQAALPLGPFVGSGGASLPTQTSVVASLRTGINGRHYRGRFYMPATGAALTTHQLASSLCTTLATTIGAYLTAINAIPSSWGAPVVIVPNAIGDFGTAVTDVIVDSRADIQRRRADKTPAVFSAEVSV